HPHGGKSKRHPRGENQTTGYLGLCSSLRCEDYLFRDSLGDGSTALRDLVRNLISEGNKKILLNLRNVDYIDSSGLGELVSAFTSMRSQGGELKLLNLTKRVRALLQITKLLTVFDITDDEATSVKSFSPAIWQSSLPDSRAAV